MSWLDTESHARNLARANALQHHRLLLAHSSTTVTKVSCLSFEQTQEKRRTSWCAFDQSTSVMRDGQSRLLFLVSLNPIRNRVLLRRRPLNEERQYECHDGQYRRDHKCLVDACDQTLV